MPINIRSISDIKDKWTRVTPGRSQDYVIGVTNPKKDWKTGANAGKENFKAAMQKVIAEDRQNKGVLKSSTDYWKQKALALGADRFVQGVGLASDAYGTGFGPYRDIIAGLTLPQRFPKGDSRNLERVRVIADALHKKKIG